MLPLGAATVVEANASNATMDEDPNIVTIGVLHSSDFLQLARYAQRANAGVLKTKPHLTISAGRMESMGEYINLPRNTSPRRSL